MLFTYCNTCKTWIRSSCGISINRFPPPWRDASCATRQKSQLIMSDSWFIVGRRHDLQTSGGLCACVQPPELSSRRTTHHCEIDTHPQRIPSRAVRPKTWKTHNTVVFVPHLAANPHTNVKVGHVSASHNTDSRKVSRSARWRCTDWLLIWIQSLFSSCNWPGSWPRRYMKGD